MIKCLMLQKWFNLSDPMLEEMLLDRLSFRRFVGLSMSRGGTSLAWMKNTGYRRARYRGLSRNGMDFALHAIAYNFKRSFSLQASVA
jgi:IS5 family transposase